MSVIKYIGRTSDTERYRCSSFIDFLEWFTKQDTIGHDIETPKADSILDRKFITLQFSDKYAEIIWVIQWSYLTNKEQKQLIDYMNTSKAVFIVYTNFEYTMHKKYGINIEKIWDAYVVEKVLNTGYTVEKSFYSLAGVYKRRFDLDISKVEQTEFGDDILTDSKIEYAATDTLKLGHLMDLQKLQAKEIDKMLGFSKNPRMKSKGANKTIWWENEFSKVTGDMEYHGITLDPVKWTSNYYKALPIVENSIIKLNDLVIKSFNKEQLIKDRIYIAEDEIEAIWTSSDKKKVVLSWMCPNIEKVSKEALKIYLKLNDPSFPEGLKLTGKAWTTSSYSKDIGSKYALIKALIMRTNANKETLDKHLNSAIISEYRDKLIEVGYLMPESTININWASPPQRLTVFQYVDSSIKDTKAQTVENHLLDHKIFVAYQEYSESYKLITTYGLKYLDNIDSDGRVRCRLNPILVTGRLAASGPNLMQVPRNQDYRDPFIASNGWKIVGADYSSEEILIIAILSQDPNWLKSFRQGDDVHSVNAFLIYEKEWEEATEEGCVFKSAKQKCSCKEHKEMRFNSKSISFGLSYGLSAYGAAVKLKITKSEAQQLINKFFAAFPSIKAKLQSYAKFGVKYGYIAEPIFGRPRFYDKWKLQVIRNMEQGFDMSYKEMEEAKKQRSSIERESMNMPIQSAAAAILKIACVLLRRYIRNNNVGHKVRLLLPQHDELITEAREDYAKEWSKLLQHYMELAGKLSLKTNLLKAEPYIADHWIKD